MSDSRNKQYVQFFVNSLSSELQKSLDQATGAKWTVSETDKPGAGLAGVPPVLYRLVLKGDLNGSCCMQFVPDEAKSLTALIEKKTPAAAGADSLLAMMENTVTELMLALIAEYGEVELNVEAATELGTGDMEVVPLRATADGNVLSIVLYLDPPLVDSMVKKVQAQAQPESRPMSQASSSQGGITMESLSQTTGIDESKLKLILDVELNLLLRFGQRQLTLREILDLNSGSVIELDRQVDEPIELLLDGRVIARGEAVVVDGNYGLRVTEVPLPMVSQLTQ